MTAHPGVYPLTIDRQAREVLPSSVAEVFRHDPRLADRKWLVPLPSRVEIETAVDSPPNDARVPISSLVAVIDTDEKGRPIRETIKDRDGNETTNTWEYQPGRIVTTVEITSGQQEILPPPTIRLREVDGNGCRIITDDTGSQFVVSEEDENGETVYRVSSAYRGLFDAEFPIEDTRYDASGRLQSIFRRNEPNPVSKTEFEYDEDGRLVRETTYPGTMNAGTRSRRPTYDVVDYEYPNSDPSVLVIGRIGVGATNPDNPDFACDGMTTFRELRTYESNDPSRLTRVERVLTIAGFFMAERIVAELIYKD